MVLGGAPAQAQPVDELKATSSVGDCKKLPKDDRRLGERVLCALIKSAVNVSIVRGAAIAVLAIAASLAFRTAASAHETTVIRNVFIVDAENGLRGPADVTLNGDRIAAVVVRDESEVESEPTSASPTHKVIDGTNRYLIPGLWDAHVHLAYDPKIDHRQFFPLALAHGVTYLRDIGGHLDKLVGAREGAKLPGVTPDLYISGPLIDGAKRVYDGSSAGNPDLSLGVGTPEEARAAVDDLAKRGVHFLKAYELLSPDVLAAIVERADYHGLRVAAHSPLSLTAMQTARSGVDDLQHLRNLEMGCSSNAELLFAARQAELAAGHEESGAKLRSAIHRSQREPALSTQDDEVCDALIAELAQNNVFQTPTLTVATFLSEKLYARDAVRATYADLPEEVYARWINRTTALSLRAPTKQDRMLGDWSFKMTAKLHAAGVPIIAGTDAPIGFIMPGASLHEELKLLSKAGLTPIQTLAAATITPAKFFELQDEQGQIAPDMKADLVLLRANPLDHIGNTAAIEAVFKDGFLHDRTALDAMLAAAKMPNS